MPEKKQSTVAMCEQLAEPVANEMEITIWDVVFEKEGAGWYLRYFIDTEDGISINQCETFSRRMSDLLDESDPIVQSYCLEVSSPGVERKFTRPWHYAQYTGTTVLVRLIRPVEGRRDFIGELRGFDSTTGEVTVKLDEDLEMAFRQEETAFVRLYDEELG